MFRIPPVEPQANCEIFRKVNKNSISSWELVRSEQPTAGCESDGAELALYEPGDATCSLRGDFSSGCVQGMAWGGGGWGALSKVWGEQANCGPTAACGHWQPPEWCEPHGDPSRQQGSHLGSRGVVRPHRQQADSPARANSGNGGSREPNLGTHAVQPTGKVGRGPHTPATWHLRTRGLPGAQ